MIRISIAPTMLVIGLAAIISATPASAGDLRGGGKLLLTNGISTIEGSSGGGLTPWATIAGNETRDGIGAQASVTVAEMKDYDFQSASIAVGIFNRVEISYARQRFDTNRIGGKLGLGNDYAFDQDIYGAKLKIAGDLVYGPEMMPAVAVGVQVKKSLDGPTVRAVGARRDQDVDYYVSATKLLLARSVLVNVTARATRANQFGLLGFGGDKSDHYDLALEGSAAYQISRNFVVGGEVRSKPDKLSIAREEDAFDAFAAYALGRHITATLAYSNLGSIATSRTQHGILVQLQGSF